MKFPRVFREDNVRVTVYRLQHPNGDDYHSVVWYDAGKRKRESITDRDAAIARAEELLTILSEGKKPEQVLSVAESEIYRLACERIAPTKMSLLTVVDAFMRTWSPEFRPMKVREVVASLQQDKLGQEQQAQEKTLSTEYAQDLKYRLKIFEKDFGNRLIHEVTGPEVVRWLASRETRRTKADVKARLSARPWSHRTRNNYLKLLRTFWNWARKNQALPAQPHALEKVELWKCREGAYSLMSVEHLAELLAWCEAQPEPYRNQLLPYLALQAWGGLRVEEAKRLHWEDCLVEHGTVTAIRVNRHQAKTGARRNVQVLPALASVLYEFKIVRRCQGSVVTFTKPDLILHRFYRDYVKDKWKHNQLRHSCASHLLQLWKDASRVALQLGTSVTMLNRNYSELDVTPVQTAAWWDIRHDVPHHVLDEFANNLTSDHPDEAPLEHPLLRKETEEPSPKPSTSKTQQNNSDPIPF